MNWLKVLVPGFLKRLDNRLLKNNPLVWRTRIHYVLFYSAIVFNLLIFGFYQGFPLSTDMLGSSLGNFRLATITMGLFAVFFWGWEVRKFAFVGKSFRNVMVTVFIYWLGCASIGVNIWTINKSVNFKVAEQVDSETLSKDMDRIAELNELRYTYNEQKSINRGENSEPEWQFNIDDMIVRYGIHVTINEDSFLEPSIYTPTTFLKKYSVPITDIKSEIRSKIYLMQRTQKTTSWTDTENDFQDFYFILFIGLMGLPLLGLLISNVSMVTVVSLAFAHFLLFIGMVMDARPGDVGFRYSIVGGIGVVLLVLLRRNWKAFRLVHLFILALIPIAYSFYQMDNNFEYDYNHFYPTSVGFGLLETMALTLIIGFVYWLYQCKVTKPEVE